MPEENDPYERAGLALILAAMLFLILAFLGAGLAVAPLLIVSSLGCFLTGILLLTFTRGRIPDPAVVSLLEIQHQANLAALLSRAGSRDPPVFFPSDDMEGRVGQFHALPPGSSLAGVTPARHLGRTGIILPPACTPLVTELESRFHLRVPADPARLSQLLEEVAGEILEIADRVTATGEPGEVRVELAGFALFPGCRAAGAVPQDPCLLSPCTICSLVACLAVRATGRDCQIAAIERDDRQESVHLVLSFTPRFREEPAVGAPPAAVPVPPGPAGPLLAVPEAGDAAPAVAGAVPPEGEPVTVEELVRKAAEGLVLPAAEPAGLPPEEPVMPPIVTGEPVPPFTVGEPPLSMATAWWEGHPGTRRLRYLR